MWTICYAEKEEKKLSTKIQWKTLIYKGYYSYPHNLLWITCGKLFVDNSNCGKVDNFCG